MRRTCTTRCPAAGRGCSTSAAGDSPVVSGSGWCWLGRSRPMRRRWSWSSRRPRSTRTPRPGSRSASPSTVAGGPRSSPPSHRCGCTTRTASSCSTAASPSPPAATSSCSRPAPSTGGSSPARSTRHRSRRPTRARTVGRNPDGAALGAVGGGDQPCLIYSSPRATPGATGPTTIRRSRRSSSPTPTPRGRTGSGPCGAGTCCASSAPRPSTSARVLPSGAGRWPTTLPCSSSWAGCSGSGAGCSRPWCCSTPLAAATGLLVPRLLGDLIDRTVAGELLERRTCPPWRWSSSAWSSPSRC